MSFKGNAVNCLFGKAKAGEVKSTNQGRAYSYSAAYSVDRSMLEATPGSVSSSVVQGYSAQEIPA